MIQMASHFAAVLDAEIVAMKNTAYDCCCLFSTVNLLCFGFTTTTYKQSITFERQKSICLLLLMCFRVQESAKLEFKVNFLTFVFL